MTLSIAIPQSGIVPYRIQDNQIEVLLITSSSGKRWIVPKGLIELGMSAADSAVKEAQEEAGVLGTAITPAIGVYETKKWGLPCRVEVFLMRVETVLDDWPEASVRKRKWMSIPQAIERVDVAALKRIFEQLPEVRSRLDAP